ncbi:MAG: Kelch repeat-containing protein [Planctomycetota bacterium]|jgi:hypothetical protein
MISSCRPGLNSIILSCLLILVSAASISCDPPGPEYYHTVPGAIYELDTTTGETTFVGNLAILRCKPYMFEYGNNIYSLLGGPAYEYDLRFSPTIEMFDTGTQTPVVLATMPLELHYLPSVGYYLPDQSQILVCYQQGDRIMVGLVSTFSYLNQLYPAFHEFTYDIPSDTWTTALNQITFSDDFHYDGPYPEKYNPQSAVVLGGKLFQFGGQINGFTYFETSSISALDMGTWEWRKVADLPEVACDVTAVAHEGMIYIFGWFGGTGYPFLDWKDRVMVFNPADYSLTELSAPASTGWAQEVYPVSAPGCIYIFRWANYPLTHTVLKYDVASDTWSEVGSFAQFFQSGVYASGRIYFTASSLHKY